MVPRAVFFPAQSTLTDHFTGDGDGDLLRGDGLDGYTHGGVNAGYGGLLDSGGPEAGIDGGGFSSGADDAQRCSTTGPS